MREILAAVGAMLLLASTLKPTGWMRDVVVRDPLLGIAGGAVLLLAAALWRHHPKEDP